MEINWNGRIIVIGIQNWRYIPFQTNSGPINMAIDEYFAQENGKGKSLNILRFYKWNPTTATIGRHQSLNAEVDLQYAKDNGIDVVRRISGGGAVLHEALGEITYAVICKISDLPKNIPSKRIYDTTIPHRYQCILEALAEGLEGLGFQIDAGRIHCPALMTEGKKISGNAQALIKNTLLQHGTILLHVDPERMYKVLKAPVGVTYTKMVQSVRAKVTGLQDYQKTEFNHSEDMIVKALKKGFEQIFQIQFQEEPISPEEWKLINILAQEKYSTKQWLEKFP
jgi:lipoate-protein ligase A